MFTTSVYNSHMLLPIIVLLPLFLGSLITPFAARVSRNASAWAAAAITAGSLGLLVSLAPEVFAGRVVIQGMPWLDALGLNFSFRLDGLSLLFALLILIIGLLIILYARYYLSRNDSIGRFYSYLMLFMAAMLGIVLSENMLMLFVFWELTSISSFLLIGYWSERSESRRGARMALAITGGGGLAMLAGFLLIGQIVGSFELSDWFAAKDQILRHEYFLPALFLVLLGAFTKSAQFPFHFWLPDAMAAPTPVSAYLHSATMVKAGIFLVARLYPIFSGSFAFEASVATIGLITMVFASYVAVFKHDLKGLLAYSTISHLGLVMFLLGLSSPLSSAAAVFHIINHATFKASLFMVAGIIDHETGTRDMRRLSGLFRYMPYTATLAMVAAASMAGVPLFNGFLSKEMFFAESLNMAHLGLLGLLAPIAVTLGGIFSVAYSMRFIHNVFFNGPPKNLAHEPHEPPRFMKIPVEILVVLCVVVGIFPGLTVAPMVELSAAAVFGGTLPEYHIAIWHGLNIPLLMSAVALAGGVTVYWMLERKFNLHLHVPRGLSGRQIFEFIYFGLIRLSGRVTRSLESGSLQRYVAWLIASVIALGAAPFLINGFTLGTVSMSPITPLAAIVWLVCVIACIASVVLHRDRLTAVILVGVVGLATALTFAYFSAPDLALTQLSVEVVTTALLLMALALLPLKSPAESSRTRQVRDLLLSVFAGVGVTALAWAVLTRPHDTIAWYYLTESVPKGGGSNVVNVILVDFRGFDTFGEITVLGIAAIGVFALMDGLKIQRRLTQGFLSPLLLSVATRALLPFALMVTVYIFLRGHNLPGGGFIAGLITSVALVMQYMADGLSPTGRRLPIDFGRVIGLGILIAGLTGLGSWFWGAGFLTSSFGHPAIALIGEIPLATAAIFDLGVFLTVVGATMLALTALAGASARDDDLPITEGAR